jgi:hemin uptake protein HemP
MPRGTPVLVSVRLVRDDAGDPSGEAPVYEAETLLRGHRAVKITLGDQVYTLRLTRAGKLILTK